MSDVVSLAVRSATALARDVGVVGAALLARQWERIGLLPLEPFAEAEDWYERQARRIRAICDIGPLPRAPVVYLDKALRHLDAIEPLSVAGDVLGPALEELEPRRVKKSAGRYVTPGPVVRTLLDMAGFETPASPEAAESLLDCACGPGSFLAEAASRVARAHPDCGAREAAGYVRYALQQLVGVEQDRETALVARLNVLLQLGPLLAHPALSGEDQRAALEGGPCIRVGDGLACFPGDPDDPFPGRSFRWCVGNPPYLREMGNRTVFREARAHRLVARRFYNKDMDYLYWFVIAGLSRVEPGGRLAYVTTAYWPESESAAFLRKYVTEHADVERVVLLQDAKLFDRARGQHNLLLGLRRRADDAAAATTRITVLCAPPQAGPRDLNVLMNRVCAGEGAAYAPERPLGVDPWPLRVTPELASWLEQMERDASPLSSLVQIRQGVQTGANLVTPPMHDLLQEQGEADDIRIGDGIFVLTGRELRALRLGRRESALYVRPLLKTADLRAWSSVEADRFVIVLRDGDNLADCPGIAAHLARFRSVLERRREFDPAEHGEGARPWFASKRARARELVDGPKILTPQQATAPSFTYTDSPVCVTTDARVLLPRYRSVNPLALLAVLNSSILAQWCRYRLKRKGDVLEFYGATFAATPVPARLPDELEQLARAGLKNGGLAPDQQRDVDRLVAQAYGVPFAERTTLRVV